MSINPSKARESLHKINTVLTASPTLPHTRYNSDQLQKQSLPWERASDYARNRRVRLQKPVYS
jgi:hypothetical protein